MLSALIFGTDQETTSQLQQLCSLTQDVCVFRSLERYPQGHESMRLLNSFAPQLVFLGIEDEAAAHAVEHDIRSILPSAAVLGVSKRGNRPGIETAFGGFSVCPIPCSPDEFRSAIFQALESGRMKQSASVYAFQPAKAGRRRHHDGSVCGEHIGFDCRQKSPGIGMRPECRADFDALQPTDHVFHHGCAGRLASAY